MKIYYEILYDQNLQIVLNTWHEVPKSRVYLDSYMILCGGALRDHFCSAKSTRPRRAVLSYGTSGSSPDDASHNSSNWYVAARF